MFGGEGNEPVYLFLFFSFYFFFFFFKLPRLNYVWYIKDHIGLMKSIYDFMSKICPWAPLKLTHMPSQQIWSGMLVGKRSYSCSLQRGEFEFLVLKSTVLHSCSHHILLCKCQVMALQRKHHLSPLHVLPMQCFTVGRRSGPCRRLLLLPLPLQLLSWPAWYGAVAGGEQAKLWLATARSSAEQDLCQEKDRCVFTPHYSNWVSRTKLISCIITHPWIQWTAS